MKQLLFLAVLLALGLIGSAFDPFWGVLLYYGLALLRPQYVWKWSLPDGVRWSVLAAAVLILGVLLNLPRVLRRARPNVMLGLLLIQTVLLLLSCLTAFDPQIAQKFGLEYAKIFVIGVLASLVIVEPRHIHWLALGVLLALGYVAYYFNSLYLLEGRMDIFHHGFDGLDNNGTGLLLAMGLPFAFVFATSARALWQRAGAGVLGLLLLHAVMMSYSRGAMLASLAGCGWLLLRSRQRLASLAVLAVLVMVIPLLAGQEIRDRFFSTSRFRTDGSAQSRFESWSAAWQMTLDRPLLGHGIRNSNQFTFAYGADLVGRTIHSQYLQIAADSGLPAMVNYLLMLAVALYLLGRARSACLRRLGAQPPPDPREAQELHHLAALWAGFQASLVIFIIGAAFLSLEVLELSWMLLFVAGTTGVVMERQRALWPEAGASHAPSAPAPHRPERRRRRTQKGLRLAERLVHP